MDAEFHDLMKNCQECILHETRTHVVRGDYGPVDGICFVGEAPGFNEDIQGKPFVGRSGDLLNKMLGTIGLTRQDVSVINIIKCRPPGNRTPTKKEMQTCGNLWLDKQLQFLKPKLIVTLGRVALQYFFPGLPMTKNKGKIQFVDSKIPVMPIFHPAYVLRNGHAMDDEYKADFAKIKKFIDNIDEIGSALTPPKKATLDDFF